jgi:hypothetical protein
METKTFETLKQELDNLFHKFFEDMKIDEKTGIVKDTNKRFSGYPYIGEKYVEAPVKILFIPLDTGVDELKEENTYHKFDGRVKQITPKKDAKHIFNPHLAGLYATTVCLLKEELESAKDCWGRLLDTDTKGETTSTKINNLWKNLNEEQKNLLSYVAYTNRYNFVTIERPEDKRSGGKDRTWLNKDKERELLLSEIEIFKPDIIVFQGKTGSDNCNKKKLTEKYTVFEANHPSHYGSGANKLNYIENIFDKKEGLLKK